MDAAEIAEHKKAVKQALADKIKGRLDDLGLNKTQFAQLMKVQPSRVTKWLKGDHNFELKTLFQIERVLEVTLVNLRIEPLTLPDDYFLGWV